MNNTTTTPQNQIKPLLTHTIHIKSLYTYRSYLTKRPKHAITFKFSRRDDLILEEREDQTKSEVKLQRSLRLLKSAKKIDLSKFQVRGEEINQNRFQSCFKHNISKASTLYFTRYQPSFLLGLNPVEKPLKHLSRLSSLVYRLSSEGYPGIIDFEQIPCIKDPLRYLRYCPKMRSLNIGSDYGFGKIFPGVQRYSIPLKNLALELSAGEEEGGYHFDSENFSKLETVYFKVDENIGEDFWVWSSDFLSFLDNLQEVNLELNIDLFPLQVHSMLRRIAARKILKKLRLILPNSVPAENPVALEIFTALQDLAKLTHFELSILIHDDDVLKILSESLENMKQLQNLRLSISKKPSFRSFDNLEALCRKVQNLQSLHLSFFPINSRIEIPNLVLLCKPLRLVTLSLTYSQLDPTRSFLDLAASLKDSLTTLQNLKVSFGCISPSQHNKQQIIETLASLSHLQVLEMAELEICDDDFLIQIVRAISTLKYLRELTLGEIKDDVTLSAYENELEKILSKRGLRRFECQTCESLVKNCGLISSLFGEPAPCRINMRKIERKNSFLECIQISEHMLIIYLLKDIIYWT